MRYQWLNRIVWRMQLLPNNRNSRMRSYILVKALRWHSGWDRFDPRLAVGAHLKASRSLKKAARSFLFHGVNIFWSLKVAHRPWRTAGGEGVGSASRGAHWTGDTERRDRSWRLSRDGGGGRHADEERRGSLASPVPWMRPARQSSAAARQARYLLSVLRRDGAFGIAARQPRPDSGP
jgi:hypothetical protein